MLGYLCLMQSAFALNSNVPLNRYMHDVWSESAGLPNRSIKALLQTHDGYLWVGTGEGLARFDGVRFTVFSKSNTEAFKHNEISALLEDHNGNLWIGTYGGGALKYKDGKFTGYTTKTGLYSDVIFAFLEDPSGGIWIGNRGGLNHLEGSHLSGYTTKDGLPYDEVNTLMNGEDGSLWIGTNGGGLSHLKNGKFINYTTKEGLSNNFVFALLNDSKGDFWIGTYGGGLDHYSNGTFKNYGTKEGLTNDLILILRHGKGNTIWIGTEGGGLNRFSNGTFESFRVPNGLSNDDVWSIYEDQEGSLWLGTQDGLNRLKESKFTTYTTRDGLPSDQIWTVYRDQQNTFWIGTRDAGVVQIKDGHMKKYTTENGLCDNQVRCIYQSSDGSLWFGTHGGLISRLKDNKFTNYGEKEGLSHQPVYYIFEDPSGTMLITKQGGAMSVFKDGIFLPYNNKENIFHVRTTLQAHDGSFWIGSYSRGLKRCLDGKCATFTTLNGLPIDEIWGLYEDHSGTLWISTYGGGLSRYENGKFHTYTTKQGLQSDTIYQVFEDSVGKFWISGTTGIFSIPKKDFDNLDKGKIQKLSFVIYGIDDGLLSLDVGGGGNPCGVQDPSGKLWYPTMKGLSVIDPANIPTNRRPPPVAIEDVLIDGQADNYPAEGSTSFEPGKKKFEFHYTALSLMAPEKVHFKYQLVGFDRDWVNAGSSRIAYYTNLNPGNYRFRVIACNNDGFWNEKGATFGFYLQPYFYQTPWFYALGLITALFIFSAGYKIRVRQLKARENELVRLVKERTATIEEQSRKLMEMDELKTHFFANISHEFRTPLTLTMGPLENALSGAYGNVTGELRNQMETMLRNSRRLLGLINQLLDLAKIDAGKMKLQLQRHDLVLFLKRIVSLFSSFADRKNIALELHSSNESLEAVFDSEKIEQIFINLLSNALKFTFENGKIWITISEQNETAEIKVKDTGIGITKDQIAYIFDRFHQVDGSTTRRHEGTGIGLSLVKDLVEMHHGSILVKSEPGFGTEFTVQLPLQRGTDNMEILSSREEEASDISRNASLAVSNLDFQTMSSEGNKEQLDPAQESILIVEDNADVRAYIKSCLGEYRVMQAIDGEEGFQKATKLLPDLIISDIMMPKMDGYQLLKALKTDDRFNHIPVILLTSKASEDMKVEGLEAGADDYLSKPFNAKELLARSKNLLKIRRQEKELKMLNVQLEQKVQEQVEVILKSQRLTKYISKNLVNQTLQARDDVHLVGERKNITVLLSDLCGFTDLSDKCEPERITRILNEYLSEMLHLIELHGGTLARFMGDGIMAFFGAHEDMSPEEQAMRSVSLGLSMQKKLWVLRDKWVNEGLDQDLQLRIGISQDYVTLGNFGSEDLMEFTALGSGVNLAARLESSCTPGKIRVNFVVYSLTRENFSYEAPFEEEVKGFARPVRVCELEPQS